MMGVLSALFAASVLPLVPYEISEAGRTGDGGPALCALEDASGWRVSATDCEAELVSATNRALFGKGVARLRYRSLGTNAVVRLTPEASVGIDRGINAVSLWVWGHLLPYRRNPEDPNPIAVSAVLRDGAGEEIEVDLRNTNHANWFLLHRYLAPEEQERMANGGEFVALVFRGMANTGWKDIDITSLRIYRDELKPIAVTPRARRGYANFPEADQGFNTGKGRLPFPNTELTVTPPVAPETKVEWRFPEKAGSWDDFAFRYDGGEWQRFAVGGGVYFRGTTGEADSLSDLDVCGVKMRNNRPGRAMKRATVEDGQFVRTKDGAVFKGKFLTDEGEAGEGEIRFRTVGQSVIVDIWIRGGAVEEVRFGRWTEAPSSAKLIEVPFYTYRRGRATDKPSVVMAELAPGSTVFFAAAMDWTQSAASLPYCFLTNGKGVAANGATTYRPDTGGRKNDCRERFVWSVSPKFDEVLPNIPNPPSPYRARMSEKVFISYASKDVAKAKGFFRRLKDEGLKHLLVTDHEDMWRDDFESFTFRDTCAPARGGDEAQRAYTRYLRDELGYDYGPYNTFLDLAPVNRYWDTDRIMRSADGQLMGGWQRCYVPKVHFACEMNEVLTPVVQRKFGFNCAYCDQHTIFTPWTRIEYDHRVPGAATFAQTFYGFGELLLKQRELFGGPVFSEGGCHFMYAGLCDGSYAQEYEYSHAGHDWLVDFDLLRMHPLGCDVATSPGACFRKTPGGMPSDRDYAFDYFIAAEMAYGHLGRMGRTYDKYEKRLYFMMQAIGAKYGRANVHTIRYLGADGRPRTTSEALKDGSISLCHVCVRYDDGTSVLANGSYGDAATNMTVRLKDRTLTLPSGGVYAESGDRSVVVWCALGADGKRERYARSAEYEYVENGTTVEVRLRQPAHDVLRDRCWLWGHETGLVDGTNNVWRLPPAEAYYHMAEAAKSLGVANLNVVRWDCPGRDFRRSLAGLKRVTWPVSGRNLVAEGKYADVGYAELGDWCFRIADEMPNVTGFDLDDFFQPRKGTVPVQTKKGIRSCCATIFPYEQLVELRRRMDASPRPLELRVVTYDNLFEQGDPETLKPVLELADTITYWTWKAKDIPKMSEHLVRLRRLAPGKRIDVGIYLWDFGSKREMPVESIRSQLDVAHALLKRGEIHGLVFLCSSICNRSLAAVDYVRQWLARHGDECLCPATDCTYGGDKSRTR